MPFKRCDKEGKHCTNVEKDEELIERSKKRHNYKSKGHPRRDNEGQEVEV
jgi:hypothetical protein